MAALNDGGKINNSKVNTDQTATEQTGVIVSSIRVFATGIVALLPIIGIPFALYCLFKAARIPRRHWNAASDYKMAGVAMALIGLLISVILVAVISMGIAGGWFAGGDACYSGHG